MSKPVSFLSALAVFVLVSGTSSLLAHLALNEMHYAAAYASANDRAESKNQSVNSFVVDDSTMMVGNTTTPFAANGATHEEDIDLGETLILASEVAAR
ncbi:MAG: hypothetical protein ALAOOOJD_03779 [bacterium]|nr:hypothetical protein [bacterium]